MSCGPATFAAVGDVHGQMHAMVRLLQGIEQKLGRALDFVLQVGDFPTLYEGSATFPWPVYLIGGDHEPIGDEAATELLHGTSPLHDMEIIMRIRLMCALFAAVIGLLTSGCIVEANDGEDASGTDAYGAGDVDNYGAGDVDNNYGAGDVDNNYGAGDVDNNYGAGDVDNTAYGAGDVDNTVQEEEP